MSLLETLAHRCPNVGICSSIQQKTCEACIVRPSFSVVHPEIVLRDHRREERGVTAKAVSIDRRPHIRIHPLFEQPFRDFQLVEVSSDVEESSAVHWCSLRGVWLARTGGSV